MSNTKYSILAVVLLGLVVFSSWLGVRKSLAYKIQPLNASTKPDAFMDNIIAKRMGLDGKLVDELHSPRLDHYAKDNSTHLVTPSLIVYAKQPGQKPWYITALHGRAYDGSERIELWDNVQGYRPPGTHTAITFRTEAATVFPPQKYAVTDRPVKTTQGA
ncbi:MAG: LPS export ABC transporter periplasmic protein LptC, partial [Gammaproteobacteria bacterium]